MLGRCCTGPILTLKFQIVLARSCVSVAAHLWYQMKEDELNFVTMTIIFYKLFNFSGKITAISGFLFIGTHCIMFNNYCTYIKLYRCFDSHFLTILIIIISCFLGRKLPGDLVAEISTWEKIKGEEYVTENRKKQADLSERINGTEQK